MLIKYTSPLTALVLYARFTLWTLLLIWLLLRLLLLVAVVVMEELLLLAWFPLLCLLCLWSTIAANMSNVYRANARGTSDGLSKKCRSHFSFRCMTRAIHSSIHGAKKNTVNSIHRDNHKYEKIMRLMDEKFLTPF